MIVVPPCEGPVTTTFGERGPDWTNDWGYHLGIDVGVPEGTPILVAAAGMVEFAGEFAALGKCVVVGHIGGYRTLYAHLSQVLVGVHEHVRPYQYAGFSGNTGLSHGPHLHVEVWTRCCAAGGNPYELTRTDPKALPADPACLWQGRLPSWTEGRDIGE